MQFGKGKPSAGAFFDSDFRDIDSVLAISLLYGMQAKNDCKFAMLAMSRPDLKTAGYLDLVNRFYHGPSAVFNQLQPVGMTTVGKTEEAPQPFLSAFDKKKADGTAAYQNHVKTVIETGDPNTLYRNYLQAQYDQNCFFVLAGPATNMASALDFRGMKDLLAAKVKYLVFANLEGNSKLDPAAAKRVLAEWPTPIYTLGADIGNALPFPGASIDKEFAAQPEHPVADAYRAWKKMPYDVPSHALAASLFAGRPKESYFKVSEAVTGKPQMLVFDPAQKDKILKDYVELASMKPVAPVRFRPPVKDAAKDPADKVVVPPAAQP